MVLQRSDRIAEIGNYSFKYRGLLLPVAILLFLIPSPRLAADPAWPGVAGFLIALIGQAIRVGTIGLAYIIRGGKDHRVFAEGLVTSGLYAHCRNPMYVGNAFLLAGTAIASNSWLFVFGGISIAIAMHVTIIAAEEAFLRKKFGNEYDAYCARVPRLLPKLAGLPATFRSMSFDWRRVFLQEYGKPFDWLAAIAIAVLVNLWRADLLPSHWAIAVAFGAILVARLVLWFTAQRIASLDPERLRAAAIAVGGFFFRYRNSAFPIVLVALYLIAPPPRAIAGSETLEHVKDVVAVALALLGLLCRATVIGYAYIKRGGKGRRVYAADLVTEGMFSLSRNPLYLGNILICSGIFLMHGSPYVMIPAILFYAAVYRCIVFAEEAYLLEKFGDAYRAYCTDVPRWIPKFSRFRTATQDMKFNIGRVIRKDFTTIVGTIAILAGTEIYEHVAWRPVASDLEYLTFLFAIIVLCAVAGIVVQIVKKRIPQQAS